MQDLNDVGSALGSVRMSLETLDSGVAKGLVAIVSPFGFGRKVQVAEELQEKKISRC